MLLDDGWECQPEFRGGRHGVPARFMTFGNEVEEKYRLVMTTPRLRIPNTDWMDYH
jgi:hypothetical protein